MKTELVLPVKTASPGSLPVINGCDPRPNVRVARERTSEALTVDPLPEPRPVKPLRKPPKWAYGVTTVPSRRDDLLPRTLSSLKTAGFDQPRLFVDGLKRAADYDGFGLGVTARFPAVRTHGNWILSLYELYLREPQADRYAIFQDDFVTYKNLRGYLDRCEYPTQGYWNLYTFPENQSLAKGPGWFESNQLGRGAVATVFNKDAVMKLLASEHIVGRPQNATRGWKAIDGGIVTAMKKIGWKEYVHNPSLVQHTGLLSTMRNRQHPLAPSFRGEDFDALELLETK